MPDKYVGIDLAGNPGNETGFCVLEIEGDKKSVSTCILHSDSDILDRIKKVSPPLIAIDAPLTYAGVNRRCDADLSSYGALPVTLRGMEVLGLRGTALAKEISDLKYKTIEVYSTASAKILGLYGRNEMEAYKNLLSAGLDGVVQKRMLTKDEMDAVYAALTAYLHATGATEKVGDPSGEIVIPKV
jgi:predicted nuclease with RNAse H fold